ncbi:unnamed protein product [Porites lobata]|uniref:NACHT domain-containing protein n=1 Tax=Porites lobata TaxID=104759 RepID=A0ABN8QZ05_9CNID|nr:unnamed protein product [Porites lobata]
MAQHQERKRKETPSCWAGRRHVPPPLSIKVPKMKNLSKKSKPWSDVQLPVDILLLTVEDCEFLACCAYLNNPIKSYHNNLGYVYFGTIGESGEEALKVALMRCYKGSSGPGGSLVTVKNAVAQLRPKAVFIVGCCRGLNPQDTKLGDVVVSSKLITEEFSTPVKKNIGNLILFSSGGWDPPTTAEEEVKVHSDSEIFGGINDPVSAKKCRMNAAEKEGEGLFAAAHEVNIEWVIVKGISHFSDDSNTPNESWKSFASIMAASLVSNMLSDPVVFKEWPHYEGINCLRLVEKFLLTDSVCLEECQKKLRSLYETKNRVKIVPWEQTSAVDINKIYTDVSWVMDHRTPRGVTKEALNHYTEIFVRREPYPAPKRILVYGQPGIGKTVFTQKVTFDWCQQKFPQTLGAFDLVLLVRLRDVCDLRDVPSILAASRALASDGTVSVDNLYNYVRRHQEKVLLILDGYDEYVYTAGNQSPVLEIWNENQLSNCCVVITSREMKAETLRSSGDAVFKIDGFNDWRQEEFAGRFLKDDEDVEKFFNYLEQQDLRKLAQIPLLLLIMCLLWKGKDRNALPKKRADIFPQLVKTLFHHMGEKQFAESVFNIEDYSEELYALGRSAFEALINDCLYIPRSELPNYDLIKRLIEVGLFQVLNMSSLNPEKGVYFIHKCVQEYFAGCFLKEELILSKKDEITNSLSKLDSVEKILKMNEVIKFAGELSEQAAREIVIHLMKMAANEEELTKYTFDSKAPSGEDFSEDQRNFLLLSTELFFYCSAKTKRNLFPTFLSSFRGVLLIEADQLNDLVKEKLVKTTVNVNYVFFTRGKYTEQDYKNLTILSEQLNAVIVSCLGEKKASEFLSNLTWCPVDEFFLKKEENNTHLYFTQISRDRSGFRAHDIIKALISKQETTTKKTNMNGDESSEESSSSCCSKRHGLSRVRRIVAVGVNRSDVEQLIEMMPFITAPHVIRVWAKPGEVFDAEVTESLLRSIPTTHKLKHLTLHRINVTSSPAVEFIDRVFKQDLPNLVYLNMSYNSFLGAGVDSLIQHLSCAPHLETLALDRVKMTPQQVMNLSSAIKQNGNITDLESDYHELNGDPKPEHKWQSEDYWKRCFARLFPDSSSELEDDLEQVGHRNKVKRRHSFDMSFILAETHPSVHGSSFLAHDPNTVGTFPVPPNPAAGVVLAEAPTPAEHGSSHGQTSFSGYLPPHVDPQHHSSPDIHTRHHNIPSVIFTPERSWGYPYLSGSGLSTVTQGGSHLECLFVNKTATALQRNARPSAYDEPLPVYGQETVRPVPLPHYRAAEVPISVAHGFSHDTALFDVTCPQPVYPQHYSSPYSSTHHHSGPSAIFTPERSLGSDPHPRSSGMSTVTHPSEMQEFCSPHGTLGRPMHGLQPQTTIPSASNFRCLSVSTITHPPRIQETPSPALHGLRHQSTIPDIPNLGGYGLSTYTLQPQTPELRASYGTPSLSLRELQPHHTFPDASYLSGCGLSTVTHLPGISGRSSPFGTIRPPQYELQPQSAIPGDPHRSDPATSSVTHPSVIPFPSDGTLRPPQHGTHSQNVIPGVPYRSGPVTSSVTHWPVNPGRVSPYGTLRSHPPSSQSRMSFMRGHKQNADDETDRP